MKLTQTQFKALVESMVKKEMLLQRAVLVTEQNFPPPVPTAAQGRPGALPPPVPPVGSINIDNVLQKRKSGQQLSPQEKRAYLDHVAQTNAAGSQRAGARREKELGGLETAIGANPDRFVDKNINENANPFARLYATRNGKK